MAQLGVTLFNYMRAFSLAWKARHNEPQQLLTPEESEFSPAALALVQRPVSPTLRLTALLLIALVCTAVCWVTFGHVDIVVTATGQAIPGAGTKAIASVETAVVKAIYVRESQHVKAGDILLELDASTLRSDFAKATDLAIAAQLQMARARALIKAVSSDSAPVLPAIPDASAKQISDERQALEGQYRDFHTRLGQIDQQLDQYAQELPVAEDRENIYKALLKSQDVSRDSWLDRQQQRIDIEGKLAAAREARNALIAQTLRDANDAYVDAAKAASSAKEDAHHAAIQANWLTLRAPVDGVAQQMNVHTLGGVVQAAQPLLLVVPTNAQVQVQAFLENKDVGFVKIGQRARVKISAFDYTKYGAIDGVVSSISGDAIQGDSPSHDGTGKSEDKPPRYLVRVSLNTASLEVNGSSRDVVPGMAADIEIKTGNRRIIDYILSPIIRNKNESLHER